MNDRRQRTLEAYRDGRLSPRKRARVREWLVHDEECRDHVERGELLSELIRESWSEGPTAPSPERLLAAIRPAMRQVDRERAERSLGARIRAALGSSLGVWLGGEAGPAMDELSLASVGSGSFGPRLRVLELLSGLSVAAASVCAAVLFGGAPSEVRYEAQHLVALPTDPIFLSDVDQPSSVYDLAEGDSPLMVYERDGATVIYVGEEPAPDDLSLGIELEDWA